MGSMSRQRRRTAATPAVGGRRLESLGWAAGVNAGTGWAWDGAMMLVAFGLLRILQLLGSPVRPVARRRGQGRSITILMLVSAAGLAGCGPERIPIPSGSQVVHVSISDAEVRLEPATVRAGDVYLVLDEPANGGFAFVERGAGPDTFGPLSDDDLERLAQGDTEGTSIGGVDAGGCSPEQDAASRGQMGPCGNVMKAVVAPGKYAILGPGWTEQVTEPRVDPTAPPGGFVPPSSMGVLEVLP